MKIHYQSTTGLCPKCQAVKNLGVNIERRKDDEATVETATTHCQACGSFVSREIREVAEEAA